MASLGAVIRKALGRYERPVSNAYRGMFLNLEDLASHIRNWTDATRILEIGCGEGAMAELLTRDYSEAEFLGIDIIGHLGRMYEGRRQNVSFRQVEAQALAHEMPGYFDLVVLNDVLHHVPDPERDDILAAAGRLLSPEGILVFKDWVRRPTLIHAACYVADAYVGGDRSVRYMDHAEQVERLTRVFGPSCIRHTASIRPWTQNFAFGIKPNRPQ